MRRWGRFLARALIALAVALVMTYVLLMLPMPVWWTYTVVPVSVFGVICYLGKLLYDTLFYDRYWP